MAGGKGTSIFLKGIDFLKRIYIWRLKIKRTNIEAVTWDFEKRNFEDPKRRDESINIWKKERRKENKSIRKNLKPSRLKFITVLKVLHADSKRIRTKTGDQNELLIILINHGCYTLP